MADKKSQPAVETIPVPTKPGPKIISYDDLQVRVGSSDKNSPLPTKYVVPDGGKGSKLS